MYYVIREKQNIGEHFLKVVRESGRLEKLREASTIILKPNISGNLNWDNHSITGLYLLKEVLAAVLRSNKDALVYIGESDSRQGRYAYRKFQRLNFPDCLKIETSEIGRVKMLDLTRDNLKKAKDGKFVFFNKRNGFPSFSKKLLNADFLISISNVKTHMMCKYTGACKNLFGCLPDSDKSIYHGYIHKVIHDVNLLIKPDICIVDGFRGMQGNGPTKGESVDFRFMVFSDNSVEADFTAAGLIGINPMKVKYLKLISMACGKYKELRIPDAVFNARKPDLKFRIKFRLKGILAAAGYKILRHGI